MANDDRLGGRLPLLFKSELSAEQTALYERMYTKQVAWSEQHHFRSTTDDGRLIGPFNPLLYSPTGGAGFLDFEHAEDESWSLDERTRQVVILSVGSVWNASYEVYAHSALIHEAGLSDRTVKALANGQRTEELTEKERIAQAYTLMLASAHRVSDNLYKTAEHAFGRRGMVDIALLIGRYLVICTLLNGFGIPRPD